MALGRTNYSTYRALPTSILLTLGLYTGGTYQPNRIFHSISFLGNDGVMLTAGDCNHRVSFQSLNTIMIQRRAYVSIKKEFMVLKLMFDGVSHLIYSLIQ